MRKSIIIAILVLPVFFLNARADEIWVDISDFAYGPGHLFVEEGTTVTWVNYDGVAHTVTSDANLFDSGLLSQGSSWSYTFNTAGDYDYHCTPHPYMVGEVHVRSAANLDLMLDLMPVGGVITIPSGGGSFQYTATATNQTTFNANFDYWVKVYLPNNTPLQIVGPVSYGLAAGRTASKTISQFVPPTAPSGTYRYVGYIGTAAANPEDTIVKGWGWFEFTKSPLDGGDLGGWESAIISSWSENAAGTSVNFHPDRATDELQLWNSPEPFNPTTTINYTLPADGLVNLEVFNMLGARVATLVNGFTPAGQHQVTFEASHLTSGMYLYRLNFEGQVVVGKMLLVK